MERCEKAWEFLMEAMQGRPVEEGMYLTGSVEGAWQAVMTSYQPRGDAARDHLEKHFDNIDMQGDEDLKLLFARVEGKLNILASLGILKSDREVVRLITRRLPPEFFDVEQRNTLTRPGTTCSEMEEIVRASYANRKTKALEERKLAAVMSATAPSVDPHAVGGGFQANSCLLYTSPSPRD